MQPGFHSRLPATMVRTCVFECGCPHPLSGVRSIPCSRARGQPGGMSIEVVESLLTSPWAYLLIFVIAALDAVIPAVPSEATVISAGVLAGTGDLSLLAVVSAGAAGALIGDATAYGGGRLMSERAVRWLQKSARGRRESERAARLLDRRGPLVIVTARFVPGGRTAATFTAGWFAITPDASSAGPQWPPRSGRATRPSPATSVDRCSRSDPFWRSRSHSASRQRSSSPSRRSTGCVRTARRRRGSGRRA
jgi:membrane protein YqaA with SNARE-associated domain